MMPVRCNLMMPVRCKKSERSYAPFIKNKYALVSVNVNSPKFRSENTGWEVMVLSPLYLSITAAEIALGWFGHHDFPNLSRLVAPASPTGAVLLSRAEVCSLSTVTRGAADVGVIGVNTELGLNHHHAVIILVTAVWVCGKRGREKKGTCVTNPPLFTFNSWWTINANKY